MLSRSGRPLKPLEVVHILMVEAKSLRQKKWGSRAKASRGESSRAKKKSAGVEEFARFYRKHPHGASFGGAFKQHCDLNIPYPQYSWPGPKLESPAKALQFPRRRDGESLFLGGWRAFLALCGRAWRLALGALHGQSGNQFPVRICFHPTLFSPFPRDGP